MRFTLLLFTLLILTIVPPTIIQSQDTNSISALLAPALAAKARGETVILTIPAGEYREFVSIANASNAGRLIIHAQGVTLSAGERLTNWEQLGGVYSTAWSYRFGSGVNIWQGSVTISPLALRRENLYVNDVRYTPTLSQSTLSAGKFYVDERNGRIYVYPLAGVDLNSATVETSAREYALRISNSNNIEIHDLAVKYGASNAWSGCLSVTRSQSILLQNVSVSRCSYAGVQVDNTQSLTIRNLLTEDNGARGLGINESIDILIEDVRLYNSGWRLALDTGGLTGWDGGNKFFRVYNVIMRRVDVRNTQAPGLWLDYDNHNVLIDGFSVANSKLAGVFIEANCSPTITLTNGVITGTPAYGTDLNYFHAGLFVTGTNGLQVSNVSFADNARYDILAANPVRLVNSSRPAISPTCTTNQHGLTFTDIRADSRKVRFAHDTTGYVRTITWLTSSPTVTPTSAQNNTGVTVTPVSTIVPSPTMPALTDCAALFTYDAGDSWVYTCVVNKP